MAEQKETKVETGQPEAQLEPSGGLLNILNVLVPAKTVTLMDASGEEHVLAGALPARRQILVLRKLDELKTQVLEDEEIRGLIKGGGNNLSAASVMSTVIDNLVRLAGNETVLNGLGESFGEAHPTAVKAASENLKAAGVNSKDPLDLFPLEEIVAGLIPFFVRLLKRGASALGVVMQTVEETPPLTP